MAENRLGKRSLRTRKLTAKHLAQLYGLDPGILLFRALRDLWPRDPDARDALLKALGE
ncbi:hypothetical protein [Deferrisoma palaeochoriense]